MESLADTPLLKGKLPVTKLQIKKKTPATGEAKGQPPSPASGASPTSQPPNSYAAAIARTSMDTSELMDIEQLCAMRPQHSSTPPAATKALLPLPLLPIFSRPTSLAKALLLHQSPRVLRLHQLSLPAPPWQPRLQVSCRPLQRPVLPKPLASKPELLQLVPQKPHFHSEGSATSTTTADYCKESCS